MIKRSRGTGVLAIALLLGLSSPLVGQGADPTVSFSSSDLDGINDEETTEPFVDVEIDDPDDDPVSVTIALSSVLDGTAGTFPTGDLTNPDPGVYELSSRASSDAEGVLQGLTFTPDRHRIPDGTVDTVTFNVTVTDDTDATAEAEIEVEVTGVNEAPELTPTPSTVPRISDVETAQPFENIEVFDDDETDGDTVVMEIGVSADLPGQPGTFPTGDLTNPEPGIYELPARAASDAEDFLQNLAFTPDPNRIPDGDMDSVTFTVTVTDGSGEDDEGDFDLEIEGLNSDPRVSGGSPTPGEISDKETGVPFQNIVVSDDEDDNVAIRIEVSDSLSGEPGTLSTDGDLTSPSAGVYELSSRAPGDATEILQGLEFEPTENRIPIVGSPSSRTEDATFRIEVTDGAGAEGDGTLALTVRPVNDQPSLGGSFPSEIDDNQTVDLFSDVTVVDVDNRGSQPVTVEVTLSDNSTGEQGSGSTLGTFQNGVTEIVLPLDSPANVQQALRQELFEPNPNLFPPEETQAFSVHLRVTDEVGADQTRDEEIDVRSVNDAPSLSVTMRPSETPDNQSVRPFRVEIDDPDPGETFSVDIGPPQGESLELGALEATLPTAQTIEADVKTAVENVTYTPTPNVLVGAAQERFVLTVTDAFDATSSAEAELTVIGINDPPEIVGVPPTIFRTTDDEAIAPFETVEIVDVDASQQVEVELQVSNTALGSLKEGVEGSEITTLSGAPGEVTERLREVVFDPVPGAIALGDTESVRLTIRVEDGEGAVQSNSDIRVAITSVNGRPEILFGGEEAPSSDPLGISPDSPVQPFDVGEVTVDDDSFDEGDSDGVTVSVSIEDPSKGTLTDLGAFTETEDGSGIYEVESTSKDLINDSLADMVFEVNESYSFPSGRPGLTSFTIKAVDPLLNTAVKTMRIVLDASSENHVVRLAEDVDQPGSLRSAIENADNNDVITFALPEYPALIRLDQERGPLRLDRHVTLKGPGARNLTISGDSDGDGVPDMRLFDVSANVEMEGLRLIDGNASTGGAIYVDEEGALTMKYCEIADCRADQWGGAIDVHRGALTMENCLVTQCAVDEALGLGGGALSLYTDAASVLRNTTFSGNRQGADDGFGGGAIYVENFTPEIRLNVDVRHCTFAENIDRSGRGSSITANVFGTHVTLKGSIFADGRGRNLWVQGAGRIVSGGGNISDDMTRVTLTQGGEPMAVHLLQTGSLDQVAVDPELGALQRVSGPIAVHPLQASSPAIGAALTSSEPIDQRGVIRDDSPDAGAFEFGLKRRLVLNEIDHTPDSGPQFLEFYNPRDSELLNLEGYSVWVNGEKVYTWPSMDDIEPGNGVLVSFGGALSDLDGATAFTGSGSEEHLSGADDIRVTLPTGRDASGAILAVESLADFADPSFTAVANDSLTLTPQYVGAAYLPHSVVGVPPIGGADLPVKDVTERGDPRSPGRDTANTPFGSPNAFPTAIADPRLVDEDLREELSVLQNDRDADGDDELVIVDVSATENEGGEDASATTEAGASVSVIPDASPLRGSSIVYDPRQADDIQALPEGAKIEDEFYYSIVDVRAGEQRDPTERSQTIVPISLLGANDVPLPVDDTLATDEETILRVMGDPDLPSSSGGMSTELDTDDDFPVTPQMAPVSLLSNDQDPDSDDDGSTLHLVGVVDKVTPILGFAEDEGSGQVIVISDGHGLADGTEILIAGYGGHRSYNGRHVAQLLDEDRFIIPVPFVDDEPGKGLWAILPDDDRLSTTTAKGAEVRLEIRTDRVETSIIYNPRTSDSLNALGIRADGTAETDVDRFYYAVEDRHGAIGIGAVDITVSGVNDAPQPAAAPDSLSVLDPVVDEGSSLASLVQELEVRFHLPSLSGEPDRSDVEVTVPGGGSPSEARFFLQAVWSTDEETELSIPEADILENDQDVDRNDALRIESVDSHSRGGAELSLAGDGGTTEVVYDPTVSSQLDSLPREAPYIDTFGATVTDDRGGSEASFVTVLVTGVNDSPVAVDDNVSTPEDEALVVDAAGLLDNDSDADIDGAEPDDQLVLLPFSDLSAEAPGATAFIENNQFTYDPTGSAFLNGLAEGETFEEAFEYRVTDGSMIFANDDRFSVRADGSDYRLSVLGNDRNLIAGSSDMTIVDLATPNEGGTAAIAEDGATITYSPEVNFVGNEFFTYTVSDGEGNMDSGLVTVQAIVNPLNGDLQAQPDAFTVAQGQDPVLPVLANDHILPASGDALTIERIVTSPERDAVEIVDGGIEYLQAADGPYPYTESFAYEVSGGGSARAVAEVTVEVIDRHQLLPVSDDVYSVQVNSGESALDVLANDNILPGNAGGLRIAEISDPPEHGTAAIGSDKRVIRYAPDPGFLGTDSLEYLAVDGFGGTGIATATISVGGLVINDDRYSVPVGGATLSLPVLENDRIIGAEIDTLTIVNVAPMGGSDLGDMAVGSEGETLAFTPGSEIGEGSFRYTVQDASGREVSGTVVVSVSDGGLHAGTDFVTVAAGSSDNALPVLANDVSLPPELERTVTIAAIGEGLSGPDRGGIVRIDSSSGELTYTPPDGFFGEETFTYTVTDSRRTDTAKVVVQVTPGRLSANSDAYTVYFEIDGEGSGTPRSFRLPVLENDRLHPSNGALLEITGVGIDDINADNAPDQEGKVEISSDGTALRYTPRDEDGSFPYVERFTYEITDGSVRRTEALVEVEVRQRGQVRDSETNDDAFAVQRNSRENLLQVLANDNVKPAPAVGWEVVEIPEGPSHGTVTIQGAALLYTPEPDFLGVDQLSYRVSDGLGGTGTATVTVEVGQISLSPDRFTVLSGSGEETFDVLLNDGILPGDAASRLRIDSVGVPSQGGTAAVVSSDDGPMLEYKPASGFSGREKLTYQVADDSGRMREESVTIAVVQEGSDQDAANVNVTVNGVNDPPVISGTVSGQSVYQGVSIRPFSGVTITEVDAQGQEPVRVSVTIDDPGKGFLTQLDGFTDEGGGVYRQDGVTGAEASVALRALSFVPTPGDRVTPDSPETVRLTLEVDDGIADPVIDDETTVIVHHPLAAQLAVGDRSGNSLSGHRVAVSGDLIVIGSPFDRSGPGYNRGAAYLFGRNQGGVGEWGLITTLVPEEPDRADRFGSSVAVDGDTVVVGAPLENFGYQGGAAYIFRRDQGGENEWGLVKRLIADESPGRQRFGHDVAIRHDTVLVTARRDDYGSSRSGAAYVFGRNQGGEGQWGMLQKLLPSEVRRRDAFGFSGAIDGATIAVGAPLREEADDDSGAVYVFEREGDGEAPWAFAKKLVASDGDSRKHFGISVDVDRQWIAVGASDTKPSFDGNGPPFNKNAEPGAAYLFERDLGGDGNWGERKQFTSPEPKTGEQYGHSVSIDRGSLIVGAPVPEPDDDDDDDDDRRGGGNQDSASGPGATYVYMQDFDPSQRGIEVADQWGLVDRLTGADDNANHFGVSVAVDGGTVVVGSNLDRGSEETGTSYVFQIKQNNPPQVVNPLPDRIAEVGELFEFQIGENRFDDPDWQDELAFSAGLANGDPLPEWLRFDAVSAIFQGTPSATDMGDLNVSVLAADESGAAVTDEFLMEVVAAPVDTSEAQPGEAEPWEQWLRHHFGEAGADLGIKEKDSDGDGYTNWQEYAFGLDPTVAQEAPVARISRVVGENRIEISFRKRTNDPTLTYSIQFSSDLSTWEWAGNKVAERRASPMNEQFERVSMVVDESVLESSPYFFRIVVSNRREL